MKKNAIFIFFAISFSGFLQALTWPAELKSAPVVDFPMSTGRSSWQGMIFDFGKNIDLVNESTEELFETSGDGIFGAENSYWGREINVPEYNNYWYVGRLACPKYIECYFVRVRRMNFLVTVKGSKVADAKLVYASHANRNKDGAYSGSGNLDSIFGDGIFWQQLPDTRFEETGIFCSSFVDDVNHKYKVFKRRVNFDGFIESKKLNDDEPCEAPWESLGSESLVFAL